MDYISTKLEQLKADGVEFFDAYVFENGELVLRKIYRFYKLVNGKTFYITDNFHY